MSEEITTDTLVAGENVQPVTDADAETVVEAKSEESVKPTAPNVENRDGKLFVDGVRVYTRDDTNRIAAKAKQDAEHGILSDLDVESIDQVKTVVNQLRNTNVEQGDSLNVNALRDAVKKKEQTVEELRAELTRVKTDYSLKEHISTLKDAMPTQWNADQKSAVVDLMKVRNMLHLEGDAFAIKNGEDFLTVDGEQPDYNQAVELVGKSLGLPFAKTGISTYDADKQPSNAGRPKAIDESRMKTDPQYRSAYVSLRNANRNLSRSEITDKMITEKMNNNVMPDTSTKMLR